MADCQQQRRRASCSGINGDTDVDELNPYRPLNTERAEIRVLRLENTSDAVIRCHLERVSLNDVKPEYTQYLDRGKRKQKRRWVADHLHHCLHNDHHYDPDHHRGEHGLIFPRWRQSCDHFEWEDLVEAMRLKTVNDEDPLLQKQHRILRSVRPSTNPSPTSLSIMETFCVKPRFMWGDFEAISYCWESEVKDRDVFLNGRLTKIPRSLEEALQKVRDLPEVRSGMRIWCDALCIDQDNTLEKNHQVGLMSKIFRSAFSILVWLGSESDDSATAIAAMVQHNYLCRNVESSPWDTQDDENWITRLPWAPMMRLFQRKFWHRLWIVQELALNHNMTLFLCGDDQLSRNMIQMAAESGCSHSSTIAKQIGKSLLGNQTQRLFSEGTAPGFSHQDTFEIASRVKSLVSLGKSRDHKRRNNLVSIINTGRKAQCKDSRDKIYGLLGLLPENISREIIPDYNKSRSEIYMDFARTLISHGGLTLLLSWCYTSQESALPSWVPDWTVDVSRQEVQWLTKRNAGGQSADATSFHYTAQGQLHCKAIIFDRIHKSTRSLAECPPFRTVAGRQRSDSGTQIGGRRQLCPNRYGDQADIAQALQRTIMMDHPKKSRPRTLIRSPYHREDVTLLGNIFWVNWNFFSIDYAGNRSFDVCRCTESLSDDEMSSKIEFCFNTMQAIARDPTWKSFDRFRHTNAGFDVFGHPLSAFFPSIFEHRAGCVNMLPSADDVSQPLRHDEQREQDAVMDDVADSLPQTPLLLTNEDEKNVTYAVLTLAGRRLVTTKTGYIGLLPESTNDAEDVVAVIRGCNFPVVLRPVADSTHEGFASTRYYRYIGECYVDGVMDGEIVEAATRGELPVEDIVLV